MWHKNIRNLPTVTEEIRDSFVKKTNKQLQKKLVLEVINFFWEATFTIWKVCNTVE